MKKAISILSFIFLLLVICSCSSKKDLILGVSRVDENKICEEYCLLDLRVISSEVLDEVVLDNIYSDTTYDYQVNQTTKDIRISEDVEKKIYSYDLEIKIYNPVTVNKIDLVVDDESYTFDIGNFTCLENQEKETHLKCLTLFKGELNDENLSHELRFINLMDKGIVISDIQVINALDSDIRVCMNLKDDLVPKKSYNDIASCFVNTSDDVYRLNYIIEVKYLYNGGSYTTYFEISDSSYVEATSSSGSYILVDQECFVLID
ncbi:MAG: hypothetical protein IJX78_01955 [Bacilli bacterium]|nr:hypothetical protein [Bacilli bacterium]